MNEHMTWRETVLYRGGAVLLALVLTSLVIWVSSPQTPPWEVLGLVFRGALSTPAQGGVSWSKIADVLVAWIPMLLAAAGLLVTFAAGLWNIGVEGQIVMGAVFTTWVLRALQDSSTPPALILTLAIAAGAVGGSLWALLVGLLRTYGGVNEIFGGLGLNFVATTIVLWLIFGPWKRPGIGSMSGTEPFPPELHLPTWGATRLSPVALAIGLGGMAVAYVLLKGTYFGLRLKAVGNNPRAARLMGMRPARYMLLAFGLGGALVGLAGAVQVTAVYYRLIPAISSGYGWLGLLVCMLVGYDPTWVPLVSLFFAAINIGSIQLPIVLSLDSSLAGVIQGTLVFSFLFTEGLRRTVLRRRLRASAAS